MTDEVATAFAEIGTLIQQLEVCIGYNNNTNVTCNVGTSSSDIYTNLKAMMDIQSTRYSHHNHNHHHHHYHHILLCTNYHYQDNTSIF